MLTRLEEQFPPRPNHAAHPAGLPSQNPAANPAPSPQLNPEEQELARKRDEQAAIESELAERELRSANLRAELGAFERQYLHHVGSRYAELDELKAADRRTPSAKSSPRTNVRSRPREKLARAPTKRNPPPERNPKARRALSNLRPR